MALQRRRYDRGVPLGSTKVATKRKNCSAISYNCGAICLSVNKNCRVSGESIGHQRLNKVLELAKASATHGKLANKIKEQRSQESARLREQRKQVRQLAEKLLERKIKDLDLKQSTGSIAELPLSELNLDPKRFQYKILGEHTATGEVGSLSGVQRFDPNLAGIIQVWKDPKDGKTYVVNGHNRVSLAKRLGADAMAVRYLNVETPKEARAVGALTNIAEGRGTSTDAARFFRDSGISREDLHRKGIPLRERVATEGMGIAQLNDTLFRKVINGEISPERGAIIGGSGLSKEQQQSLHEMVESTAKRRAVTNEVLSELVDTVKSADTHQQSLFDLFGESVESKSLAIEKASLQASIKKKLAREKKLFATVGKSKTAKDLERGGNVIDADKSKSISQEADAALKIFNLEKNMVGDVSSQLNEAAKRIANGENKSTVEKEIYESILGHINKAFKGRKRGDSESSSDRYGYQGWSRSSYWWNGYWRGRSG